MAMSRWWSCRLASALATAEWATCHSPMAPATCPSDHTTPHCRGWDTMRKMYQRVDNIASWPEKCNTDQPFILNKHCKLTASVLALFLVHSTRISAHRTANMSLVSVISNCWRLWRAPTTSAARTQEVLVVGADNNDYFFLDEREKSVFV